MFHVFEQGLETTVDFDSFENASLIAAWYLHEARRFFSELALPVELANAVRLDTCKRQRTGSVSRRELQRLGPVTDKEPLKNALKELEDLAESAFYY